jgi:hypothetical protein
VEFELDIGLSQWGDCIPSPGQPEFREDYLKILSVLEVSRTEEASPEVSFRKRPGNG